MPEGVSIIHETPPTDVVKRAIWWSFLVNEWFLSHPELLELLPSDATLVILPDGDTELIQHNLNLTRHTKGAQVIVRLEQVGEGYRVTPFVPTHFGQEQAVLM